MKRPSKIVLLSLTAIAAIAAFLWMRSLASWRPQKVGGPAFHYMAQHISNDARLVLATDVGSKVPYNFTTFDLSTGTSYKWPIKAATDKSVSVFGWAEPFHWHLHSSRPNEPLMLEFHDPQTHRVNHTIRWQNRQDADRFVVKINNNMAQVLSRYSFREFDLSSDKMIYAVKLSSPFDINRAAVNEGDITDKYAISSDGKILYGSWNSVGLVWEARTGKLLKRWQMVSWNSPSFYSPDGRALIGSQSSAVATAKYVFVNSATGKTLWTTTLADFPDLLFSQDDSEVVLPQKDNCEVRDVMTGHLLRQLPGPRSSDSYIFQVTHDFIFTQNRQGQILRWRAR